MSQPLASFAAFICAELIRRIWARPADDPADNQVLRWSYTVGSSTAWSTMVYSGTNARIHNTKDYTNKAILSDLLGDPRLVYGVHGNGVNVLYGNYAVNWVPLDYFKPLLLQQSISAGGPTTPVPAAARRCTTRGSRPSTGIEYGFRIRHPEVLRRIWLDKPRAVTRTRAD